mgnify:CR=1 FL=1
MQPKLAARVLCVVLCMLGGHARADTYGFGVLSQRLPVTTAEHWNPILDYVSRKAGVNLVLKITRTGPESKEAIARGEYDFVYSNHIFAPQTVGQKYQVILRPRGEPIRGQIVVPADSSIRSTSQLQGMEVGFPSKAAFVAYAVLMNQLLHSGIEVQPVFGGNQEGIMGQLKAHKVAAAGVNNQIMRTFAEREGLQYRVLWESEPYHNLPIAVHPRVPAKVAEAVRAAFVAMPNELEGMKVLAQAAEVIKQKPPFGYAEATPRDYQNYLDFYRTTRLKDME